MQTGPIPAPSAEYLHIRVLIGMVVGLGLTHLLRHFARIVERPKHKRVYWVHLVWASSMFVYLLSFWWWEFRLAGLARLNFNVYAFVTLYALLLYLLCAIVFPEDLHEYPDWQAYYYGKRGWFFGLLALAYVVDLADTLLKGRAYFAAFGPEMPLRSAAYALLCLVAIRTGNRTYHAAFAVLALAYQLSFIVRQFEVL